MAYRKITDDHPVWLSQYKRSSGEFSFAEAVKIAGCNLEEARASLSVDATFAADRGWHICDAISRAHLVADEYTKDLIRKELG